MNDFIKPSLANPARPDRRQAPRFDTNLGIDLLESSDRELPAVMRGQILNISRHGLKVRFWHDSKPGSHLSLSLSFQEHESLCVGEIIWKREESGGMVYGLRVSQWTYLDPLLNYALSSLEK